MEKVVSKRYDFAVNVLFYFEPVQRFEYRGDVFSFGVQVTARAREFCSNWRRDICFFAVSLDIMSCTNLKRFLSTSLNRPFGNTSTGFNLLVARQPIYTACS